MAILKRHLECFGVDLEWTGKKVVVLNGKNVLEEHEATDIRFACEKMNEVEEQLHLACAALA